MIVRRILLAATMAWATAAHTAEPLSDAIKRALSASPVDVEVSGEEVETLRRQIQAPRILAYIEPIRDLGGACKRLRTTLSAPVAVDAAGVRRPFSWSFEMNLCPDGAPPPASGEGAR
ncbi:hypothetical protein [Cupriavidus sp. YAF13]|uniref:hypothetical protein n=1 Tax=Cupriavidus sp. YAF13 TaxID=3233075 RepID=UPI003F8FAF18